MLLSFAVQTPTGASSAAPEGQIQVLVSGASSGAALTTSAIAAAVAETAHAEVSFDRRRATEPLVASTTPRAQLDEFVTVGTDDTNSIGDDLFVRTDVAAPVEVIHCARLDRSRAVAFPRCADVFGWQGALLTISYRREDLRDWQKIQGIVTTYLRQHEVGS